MQVCTERFAENPTRTFFDRDWQRLPIDYGAPSYKTYIPCPDNYQEMIAFAELLAKDIPFARIDFYNVSGKIYFGEITLYPNAGYQKFDPEEWDRTLGGWLILPVQTATGSQ